MRPVIEFRVRHPAQRCIGRRDVWQFSGDAGEFVGVTPLVDRQFDFSVRCSSRRCERVALLAGFSPEQVFGLGSAFRHPLRGREDANRRRQRLTRKVAPRLALDAHLAWVCGDIFTKRSGQECVNDFRLVVRSPIVEPLVERKQMARSAGVREFHRRHQFPSGWRMAFDRCVRAAGTGSAVIQVADTGADISCVRISYRPWSGVGGVAIATRELHLRAGSSGPERLHVHGVIQFDCAWVTCGDSTDRTQRRKFRMAALEALNLIRVVGSSAVCPKIRMALGTRCVARRGNIDSSTMLRMAGNAVVF